MAVGLKLYLDLLSQPCRSLFIILKQSGTPFEVVPVALRKSEHISSEFKKINKLKTVPCITEGEFKLAESLAVLRYLASTNRVSERFYSTDVKERARIDEFLEWHNVLRNEGVNYFRLSWITKILTGKQAPEAELEKAKNKMENVFEVVEDTWLASSKFVTGNQLTAADVFGVCEIQQMKLTSYDISKKYPKISEWIENVRKETNPDFDEGHKIIDKFAKMS